MKRLLLLLTALLACGLIAAGCGDDDDDDDGDDSPATTETAPAEPDSGDVTPPGDVDSVDEAVEACKRGVQTTGGRFSEDLRSDLEDICEEAADGDEEDLREASREICRRIVEETVPEGQLAREQALEACDNAATP
jgi:hypothetical protein